MISNESLQGLIDLVPGDHVCCLYEGEDERRTLLSAYIRQGLERNQKVFYIEDVSDDYPWFNDLVPDDFDFGAYLSSGQLGLLSSEEVYFSGGKFDPNRVITVLKNETERALADGYSSLRVAVGTAWALHKLPELDRLVEYEYKLNAFLPGSKCLTLCQYDRRAHEPRVLLATIALHPHLIVGTELLENVHFDLSENPFTYDLPELVLRRQISDLIEHNRAGRTLKESELAYRTLAENLPGIVYRVYLQENNHMQFFNKAAQDVTGYTEKELAVGEVCSIDPLILPQDWDSVVKEVKNAIRERRPFSVAYRLRHKDGSIRHVLEQGSPVYTQDGTPLYIDGVIFDITERRWAEEALRLQGQIIDQIHDAVVSTDLDGYVTSWSKGAERLFGFSAQEAVGRHISFVYREDQYDFLENQVITPLKRKGLHQVELEMQNKAGVQFHAHLSLSMLRDPDGEVTGMIGYSKDITDQVQAEEELRARAHQQAVVVALGQRALAGMELSALMEEAASLVAKTLDVEFCKILELMPDGEALLLRAGTGWREGCVGHVTVDSRERSQAGFTLLSNEPVIVEDLRQEQRFSGPALLVEHGVVSGMSVLIPGPNRPFGVLGAHTVKKRTFSKDDVNFLQAVANVLATANSRKRAEEALRESEERFRAQYKAIPVPTYTWRKTGEDFELIDYNDAAKTFTEGRIAEFLGRKVTDVYAHMPDVLDDLWTCLNEKKTIKREMVYRSFITGKMGRFAVSYAHIPPDLVMVHTDDITERKRAEAERARLLAVERQARHAAETLREATAALSVSLDLDEVLDAILVNLKQVVHYDNACLVLQQGAVLRVVAGKGFPEQAQLMGKEYPLVENEFFGRIRRGGGPLILSDPQEISQEKCCRGSGVVRSWMGVPLIIVGKFTGFLSVDSHLPDAFSSTEAALVQTFANQAAVVIENARLFEQVHAGRERLRMLTKKVVEVQEQERQHVSRELHDEIGQTLTAVKLSLQALRRRENIGSLVAYVDETITIVEHALKQVRRLSVDLRPPLLDDLGLVATLRWYVDRQAKWGGFEVEVVSEPAEMHLPAEIETTCFRIAQETLTNILRHAEAQNVSIELRLDDAELILSIHDDGKGFDVLAATNRASKGASLGMLGMQERASLVGGQLEVESHPGKGTTVRARFPASWPLSPSDGLGHESYLRFESREKGD